VQNRSNIYIYATLYAGTPTDTYAAMYVTYMSDEAYI